ncbi:sorting nexin-19-like [Watersipora subatra]|uniref:sorting nexin-19-like n=1 Tax=Watersipora subatra TaxID=2589382 RepID=UPI00355B67E6
MPLRNKIWDAFMLYTTTQLLLISAIILLLLAIPFGLTFVGIVLASYILSTLFWHLNLTSFLNWITWPQFYSLKKHRNYSGVVHEVELIKKLISKSFIESWTEPLGVDERTQQKVTETTFVAIDRILALVSTKKFNIFTFLRDLIHGTHLHILCYQKASVNPMPRKQLTPSDASLAVSTRFLNSSMADWNLAYDIEQEGYFREVMYQVLWKYLPVEDLSPLALEAIAAIISDNVFLQLVEYLSQQQNLLKLLIRVLSDDFENLLKSAEIKKVEVSSDTERESTSYDSNSSRADTPISDDDVDLENNKKVETVNAENSEGGFEYISEDLMKYFKIAPSSAGLPNEQRNASVDSDLAKHSRMPERPKTMPALMMMPAVSVQNTDTIADDPGSVQTFTDVNSSGNAPMSSRTRTSSHAFVQDNDSVPARNHTFRRVKSLDSPSSDIGSSFPQSNDLFVKFRDLSIPSTVTRTERRSSAKYTLYVICYQGVYRNENGLGTYSKECKVFRRFREFINLRARLKKDPQYQSALRAIQSPSWWQQVTINTRKLQEVEKRRVSLEKFIRGLVWQQVLHLSKDLEEFLGYNGGAEIEFVQEKVEIIPPAARLDKKVMRTVTGVFDKVSDKLSHPYSQSSDKKEHKRPKFELSHSIDEKIPVISVKETIPSDLIRLLSNPDFHKIIPPQFSLGNQTQILQNGVSYAETGEELAESIFQLVLLLLQQNLETSKNKGIVSTVKSFLVPYLTQWLTRKVDVYTSPPELSQLLRLFRETIWPETEETPVEYDIEKLKQIAKQCVIDELPSPVAALLEVPIRKVVDDVLEMTSRKEINQQLCYTLASHVFNNSLSMLLMDNNV